VSDKRHSKGFFGERAAAVYDERAAEMFAPAVVKPVVDMLAELAGKGPALEFGIGTGRIALPLAQLGVRVVGIDDSEAMVARFRAKSGAHDIDVTIGDFATTRVDGEFTLVYLIFNTIFNLVTQDEQVECFENARRASWQRWEFRDRDARARPPALTPRSDRHPIPCRTGRDLLRRL
jgi:SAM-dependent methyltransferase